MIPSAEYDESQNLDLLKRLPEASRGIRAPLHRTDLSRISSIPQCTFPDFGPIIGLPPEPCYGNGDLCRHARRFLQICASHTIPHRNFRRTFTASVKRARNQPIFATTRRIVLVWFVPTAWRRSNMREDLEAAKRLAVRAGAILLEHYIQPKVHWRGPRNPVTEADRLASTYLTRELKRLFPEDGFLSEEEPVEPDRLLRSRVWIIDPLDGTIEFINHLDEFAVMIGLSINGTPNVGIVYQPVTEKLY
jgi:Inositol monophosphatase family